MIPGSSTTENRFDRLVAKLNQNNSRPHSLLKVKVMNDDSLHFTRQIRRGDNEPMIVVGFENNKDGYSNIKQQARRFNIAFKKLTEMLSDFIRNRNKLPKNLVVYFVVETETYNSDGLVPAGSVFAGRYIYQGVVKPFTTISVSSSNAQHSSLPQNEQIVDLIKRYILD